MKKFSFRTVLDILLKVKKIDDEISELKTQTDASKEDEAEK